MEVKNLIRQWGWLILLIAAAIIVINSIYIFYEPRAWKCVKWEFVDENGVTRTSTIVDIKILNLMGLGVFEKTEAYKNWSIVIREDGENYQIDVYDFFENKTIHYDLSCIEKTRVERL